MSERRIYSADSVSGVGAALRDLRRGWARSEVWQTFAWDEIQSRYRRSALGLSWIALSYLMFVAGISLVFGGFSMKDGASFTHYVAVGYALIMFLIGNLSEGAWVFRGASSWIQSTSMPYSVYVFKGVARSLFPFAVQIIIALLVMLATGWRPTVYALLAIPALGIILFASVAVQLSLGFIGARYRDVQHLIQSIQRLLIFVTPIVWVLDEQTGVRRTIALLNPFTHYVQVFRDPLLGQPPELVSVFAVFFLTTLAWVVAIGVSSRLRKNLPFWI